MNALLHERCTHKASGESDDTEEELIFRRFTHKFCKAHESDILARFKKVRTVAFGFDNRGDNDTRNWNRSVS